MATTDVSLCSHALVRIGANPINSLDESDVAQELYPEIYEAMLTARPWSFAMAKKTLSRLTASPLNEWTYAFQVPSDSLRIYKVVPNVDYAIYGDKILANVSSLAVDYWFKTDESKLPSYFCLLMEYKLAADFAIPVTRDDGIAGDYEAKAENQWHRAATADSQQSPGQEIVDAPFIQVRR